MANQRPSDVRKYSSVCPIGDSDMAETSLFGPPPVAQDRRRSLRDMCNLDSILFGFFVFFCVVVTFGGSAYLAYIICSCVVQNIKFKPEEPEFQFDSAAVSLFNTTSHSELTAVWCEVRLLAINPNTKLGVFYNKLDASVLFYGDNDNEGNLIGTKRLPNFFLDKGTQQSISFKLGSVRERKEEDDVVVKTISEGRALGSFGVKLSLFYYYKTDACCVQEYNSSMRFLWKPVHFEVRSSE